MKHTLTTLAITVFTGIILFSCKDDGSGPNDLGIDARELMPLKVGNYWIYETVLFDSTGAQPVETSIDSFIVTRSVNIDGIDGYEIKIFRDEKYLENGFFRTNGSTILTCNKVFHPLMFNDSSACFSTHHFKWKKIFSAQTKNWIYEENSDTTEHEGLGYVEGEVNAQVITWSQVFELSLKASLTLENNKKITTGIVDSYTMSFEGERRLHAFNTEYFTFIPPENSKCVYFDDFRGIILENISFSIVFGKNTGIIKTFENISECGGTIYRRERNLLRYNLN